ncbi:unnamed protein product [Lactuca saligna]|uniref:MENTAL domain-containing protein n=1 Tax=Lactuca saligna TaxID=75948 RepID=A0AA36EMG0_LACSI|nr:unnamed protein product [Lactuca saligna]
MMGILKDEKSKRVLRGIRTVFFLITMIISFLIFSAPILVAVADVLLPTALFSASLSSPSDDPSFLQTLSSHLSNYDFRYSLIDIPLISIIRSGIILCVYGLCDGHGLSTTTGPYLGITTVCSVASLFFVSLKASYVFGGGSGGFGATEVALFVCSPALAIGHIVVAYRTSCRERRKLLVYKIDIEAVSTFTFKNGFQRYSKILHDARVKVKLQN